MICAVCGKGGAFHAHHVVDKGWLKARGMPENDTRNALRLCVRCHMQHEWAGPGKVDIPLAKLQDQNICYAFEAMGDGAAVYLERHYTGLDDRLRRHLDHECELCQLPS